MTENPTPISEDGGVVDLGRNEPMGVVDYVLGEGSPADRHEFAERLGRELELGIQVGEAMDLFESYRVLEVTPSGRVMTTLRREFERRRRLRGLREVPAPWPLFAIAAAAAIWFALSCLGAAWLDGRQRAAVAVSLDGLPRAVAAADSIVTVPTALAVAGLANPENSGIQVRSIAERFASRPDFGPEFSAALEKVLARPIGRFEDTALLAENLVSRVQHRRGLGRSRSLREEPASLVSPCGGSVIHARADALAAEMLSRLAQMEPEQGMDPEEQALVLRALVAKGVADATGRARLTALADVLCDVVDLLPPGPRVSVLLALAEHAVDAPADYGRFVADRTDALLATILSPRPNGGRPHLLHWGEPLPRIADAGRLLRIAPAFGTSADRAFFARCLLAAHLEERVARSTRFEHPELLAAQVYGFGDLVDREAADHALRFWPLRLLTPDYRTIVHRTWGSFPIRAGWAEVKGQILGLACEPTPVSLSDTAALLLALCADAADVEDPSTRALGS
ncbi:MAG: hypothetical protein AB7I19_02365 [Planctomycetota bacterium]